MPFVGEPKETGLSCCSGVRAECRREALSDLLGGVRESVVDHGVEERSCSFSVELAQAVVVGVGECLHQVEVRRETGQAGHTERAAHGAPPP